MDTNDSGMSPCDDTPTRASDLIHEGLQNFARSIRRTQVPHSVSGLKQVQTYGVLALAPHKTYVKSGRAIGDIMEDHPHGDGSIYEALARMANKDVFPIPYIDIDGAPGSYLDPKPAAFRYTEMMLTSFARDIFLSGINVDTLPHRVDDSGQKVVDYLIPSVPVALATAVTAVGYGEGSLSMAMNLADVCAVSAAYCRHRAEHPPATFPFGQYIDRFMPDTAIPMQLLNYAELAGSYRMGKWHVPIRMEGRVILGRHEIWIYTLPHGIPIHTVATKIEDAIANVKVTPWFERHIALVRQEDCIYIQLKKNIDVFDAWEYLRRWLPAQDVIHPTSRYLIADGSGLSAVMSPMDLLEAWYVARSGIEISNKRMRHQVLTRRINEQMALIKFLENRAPMLETIQETALRHEDIVRIFRDNYDLTESQTNYLISRELRILTATERDRVVKTRDDLIEQRHRLAKSIRDTPLEMATEVERIGRLYGVQRKMKLPRYIGYIKIGAKGCVQFESVDEIADIVARFPNADFTIYTYDGTHLVRVAPDRNGSTLDGVTSRYTTGDIFGLPADPSRVWTVRFQDGAACTVQGYVPGSRDAGFTYTTRTSRFVRQNGELFTGVVSDVFKVLKTMGRGNNTDIIHVYPDMKGVHYLLIACSEDKNRLRLVKVDPTVSRVVIPQAGKAHVIHHRTGTNWYFTLDDDFITGKSGRVYQIRDADALLDGASSTILDLNSPKLRRNPMFNAM